MTQPTMPTKLTIKGNLPLKFEPARVEPDGGKVFFIKLDPFEVCERVRAKLFPDQPVMRADACYDAIMAERQRAQFKRRNG